MGSLWDKLIAGGLSCCVSRTVLSPFNVVSFNQTSRRMANPRAAVTFLSTLKHVVRKRGVKGLWKGNLVSCIHGIPDKGLTFVLYDVFYEQTKGAPEGTRGTLAGAAAGTLVTVALFPLETISSRLAISSPIRLSGLYRGLLPTVISIAPATGLCMSTYFGMKEKLGASTTVAATASAIISCVSTWPIYGLRQRMQLSRCATDTCPWTLANRIVTSEGLAGFYVGCVPSIAKLVPKSIIQMTVYEKYLQIRRGY